MTAASAPPTVSVVVPTHNRSEVLPHAILSVLEQSYADLEIIVVDDASTDDTEQIVRSLRDQRLRYLRHDDNRGAPAARNTGIQASRGTYVAFQDSDDVWMPEKLAKQMAVIDSTQDTVDVVYCGYVMQSAGTGRYIPDRRIGLRQGDIVRQLLSANMVGTPTLMVRRTVLQEIGGFDETLGRFQDWDLAIRLSEVAQFHLVDEPLVIAHETPGSISGDIAAGLAAMRTILESHRGLYRRYPRAMAHFLAGMGHLQCLSGDLAGGRRHFRQALRITPYSPKFWAALLLSLLGARAYLHVDAARSRVRSPAPDSATA